jgi:hypothetical protein
MNPTADNPTGQDSCTHATELVEMRRRVRRQLADAVSAQPLSIERANAILDALALPALPLRWTVYLRLAFEVEVTATTRAEAFDAAEAAIGAALHRADATIRINPGAREDDEAIAEEVDHTALDT